MGKNLDMAVYAAILGMSDDELITASFLPEVDDESDRHGHKAGPQHPRAPRMRTLIRATVVSTNHAGSDLCGTAAQPVEETMLVRNVSERGMCLVLRGAAPHTGDIVIVRLPSHREYRAQVRWTDGRACGVQLFEKLDAEFLVVTDRQDTDPPIKAMGAPVRSPSIRAQMRPC